MPDARRRMTFASIGGPYLSAVVRPSAGMALNVAPLVGHGALRCAVMGFAREAPDREQLERMTQFLQRELDQGLFGLSAGLIYHPGAFAAVEELEKVRARGLETTIINARISQLILNYLSYLLI